MISTLITILIFVLIALLFLAAFVLIRTVTFAGKMKMEAAKTAEPEPVDEQRAAEHLSRALQVATISNLERTPAGYLPFVEFHQLLAEMFPRVHSKLQRERIADYSLLYCWPGSNPDLEPVLFAAHQDVVPVDPASLSAWPQPPFSGAVADGSVWGRGALDIKNQLIALLESVEILLERGYQPERTLYLGFGHDEETWGDGALAIVNWLKERGVRLSAVVDEGGSLMTGVLPGVEIPVALVGYGEEGYMTLRLSVDAAPGHSAMPPAQTAIGILARAIARLEAHPLPDYPRALTPLFKAIGPAAPFSLQVAFANLWLLGGIVRKRLLANPKTAAAIRTTTAVTMIQGGIKDNILPNRAEALVNFRLMPGDTIAGVCEHVRKAIRDERVALEAVGESAREAPAPSAVDTPVFASLSAVVAETFGGVPTAPYLVLGATDARHYTAISDQVFRFSPVLVTSEEMATVHGIGEHIPVEKLAGMVRFYNALIPAWTGGSEA